ncbi:MAG: hypothetical protein FWE98_01630 [Oscillospiraceae bacterium]|nr:hypothetical protein [Oscillospiraceae bacterium]
MTHELIERYIYAVTRRLPAKLRGDVERELASLISDMLEARCGPVTPEERDARVVLTELGPPGKLAAKYSGDEGSALIGGEYFLLYKFVLKLVLPIAAGGIAFASVLSLLLNGSPEPNPWILFAKTFGQILAGIAGGSIQAFAVITVVFAALERGKVSLGGGDFIDSLPLVPIMNERIKPWEPIAGMVFCVVGAAVFLGFPQVIGIGVFTTGEAWVPVFNAQVLRSLWPPVALWAALGVAREIVRLIEGRYTWRLAIATLVANLLMAVCAALVLLREKLMQPPFIQYIDEIIQEPLITALFAHLNLFLLGIVLFALLLDMGTAFLKARKHGRM